MFSLQKLLKCQLHEEVNTDNKRREGRQGAGMGKVYRDWGFCCSYASLLKKWVYFSYLALSVTDIHLEYFCSIYYKVPDFNIWIFYSCWDGRIKVLDKIYIPFGENLFCFSFCISSAEMLSFTVALADTLINGKLSIPTKFLYSITN